MALSDVMRRVFPGAYPPVVEVRQAGLSWDDYAQYFNFGSNRYLTSRTAGSARTGEQVADCVAPIAALMQKRASTISEMRFQWQAIDFASNRPGRLYGTRDLSILERPWVNGSTGSLLTTVCHDGDLYGNSYWVQERAEFRNELVLCRLDPSKVTILAEPVTEPNTGQSISRNIVGYSFRERPGADLVLFPAERVAHVRFPLVDQEWPEWRGRSWIGTVLEDATADSQLTGYKRNFLENAVIPGLIVPMDKDISPEDFAEYVETMEAQHAGWKQSFKTLYTAGGGDPKTVGVNFDQLDIHSVQGAGETRLAAAAGVPPVLVGFSEAQKGSALNAGNYQASRRMYADTTVRPIWREICSAFSVIVPPPAGSRLWYDDRDVAFLREDAKDDAEIAQARAVTMRTLIEAGFDPTSVVAAVTAGDESLLEHTGKVSVQLQDPAQMNGQQPALTP